MPSRQERRRAERDAAKRAQAQAGAAGAAGAAAALADLDVNAGGDWTTQAANPELLFRALGAETVQQMACEGDRDAQWSLGYRSFRDAEGAAGTYRHRPADRRRQLAGRSPQAEVGFTLCTAQYIPVAHQTAKVPERTLADQMETFAILFCGCQPWAEEGMALMEKAAGQGHAYAMCSLGNIHQSRKEDTLAVEWYTKAAEAGLPRAMYMLGEGMAAPDHTAAASWYRRAVYVGGGHLGVGGSAVNLCDMYTVGRGRASQIELLPALSTSILWTLVS